GETQERSLAPLDAPALRLPARSGGPEGPRARAGAPGGRGDRRGALHPLCRGSPIALLPRPEPDRPPDPLAQREEPLDGEHPPRHPDESGLRRLDGQRTPAESDADAALLGAQAGGAARSQLAAAACGRVDLDPGTGDY